jgi:hypothetical protein
MSEDGPYTHEDVLKLLQAFAKEERNDALLDACIDYRKKLDEEPQIVEAPE